MLVFRVFTKRFLEFSDPGYQKNSAGGTVPMEVQRWEKERSGNPGFAVFRIIREELVQKIQMKGWGKKRSGNMVFLFNKHVSLKSFDFDKRRVPEK